MFGTVDSMKKMKKKKERNKIKYEVVMQREGVGIWEQGVGSI